MKRLVRLLFIGAAFALIGALIFPVLAQDVAPGEGGIIIEGTFSGDPATFNPILASDTASTRITNLLFPALIGVDPATALFRENDPTALVTTWTASEDGLVYTFTLRDDMTWSDGTPITSADVLYNWNATTSGVVDTPQVFLLDLIENVEAPDPTTLVVTFKTADCTALNNAGVLVPVPSHVLPSDFAELNDAEFNINPTVSANVFSFGEFRPAEQVSLVANQDFVGATNGEVIPAGFIYKQVPDQTVVIEQFLAGETNVIDNPAVNRRSDLLAAQDAGSVTAYSYPGNSWDYLSLNYADPANPQNAYDEAGNPIDQGHHPLFGDINVRKAIAMAVDVDSIIQGAVFGHGQRMTSLIIPASWAYHSELPPIPYDVEAAKALLTEAGWVDDDNNPETPLVAQGAMYAEDGTPFSFVLYTNEGNTRRGAIGTIVQDSLKQIGIAVDFQAIDFNTLLDIMDGQTFDAFILGWRNGYPDDPDLTQLMGSASDIVGSGSNNASYVNARVDELNAQARSLPGCDPAERAALYHEMQEILQDDVAYVPMFAIDGMYAATSNVNGFSPYPSQLYWNVDTWSIATATN
jgi:peptide/nickel transport system substrate-binding protein